MAPKAAKLASQAPGSESGKQKRPNTAPVRTRRKVRRPNEIVTSEGTYIPSEDDTNSLDSSDEDDIETIDLSEEESDEAEEYDDDDDDEDDDDAESDDLSDSDEPEAIRPGTVSRTLAGTRRSISSRTPRTSVARSDNQYTSQSHGTFSQTRTETTQWMVAQQRSQEASSRGMVVARGGTSTRQQTIHQQSPTAEMRTGQERNVSRGNGLRLNMSLNVDVSFSGFVTGRNLSLGSVSVFPSLTMDKETNQPRASCLIPGLGITPLKQGRGVDRNHDLLNKVPWLRVIRSR